MATMNKSSVLLLVAMATACAKDPSNRDNPPVIDFPSASFEITVRDCERGYSEDSTYIFEGIYRDGHFWYGKDRLDSCGVNLDPGFNEFVFSFSSEDPSFKGVNASSSHRCINIVADNDARTCYRLEYVDKGESTINFWTGDGVDRKAISFTATAGKHIPVEGFKVRVDGVEYRLYGPFESKNEGFVSHDPDGKSISDVYISGILEGKEDRFGTYEGMMRCPKVFEIAGTVPMNASREPIYTFCDEVGIVPSEDLLEYKPGDPDGEKDENGEYRGYYPFPYYDLNLKWNPDFRWLTPVLYGSAAYITYSSDKIETDPEYTYYPSDLRERKCLIWRALGETRVNLGFTLGHHYWLNNGLITDETGVYAISFTK